MIFKEHVLPYGENAAGDLSYFIEKDYTADVEVVPKWSGEDPVDQGSFASMDAWNKKRY